MVPFTRFVVAVVLALAAAVPGMAAPARDSSMLVIPNRYRIVQLAFDVASIRKVSLVSYSTPDKGEPALFLWNAIARKWDPISAAELAGGRLVDPAPAAVTLVSEKAGSPLEASLGWASGLKKVSTLDLKTVINELSGTYSFTEREWQWLAERYNLQIKDLNEERRKYGRYGPPGTKSAVQPASAMAVPAAAAATTVKPQAVPEEKAPEVKSVVPAAAVPAPTQEKPAQQTLVVPMGKAAEVAPEDK